MNRSKRGTRLGREWPRQAGMRERPQVLPIPQGRHMHYKKRDAVCRRAPWRGLIWCGWCHTRRTRELTVENLIFEVWMGQRTCSSSPNQESNPDTYHVVCPLPRVVFFFVGSFSLSVFCWFSAHALVRGLGLRQPRPITSCPHTAPYPSSQPCCTPFSGLESDRHHA